MANPDKGEFDLEFGDGEARERLTFKMGTAALIEAQEQIGRETGYVPTLEELMRDVMLRQRLGYIRAFLWAGLRKYHPTKTIEDVTTMLDAMTQEQSIALLGGLTGSTTPEAKDLEALRPKDGRKHPRKAQTGKGRANGVDVSTLPPAPAV